ncbi:cytochrome P450 [Streptomyces sp. NPDC058195]|uniref:cytochrome P450 n=1 Tax=Streptomyces sp. NPDC058195 TaxID=3346375 RepID=UPI0036E74D92
MRITVPGPEPRGTDLDAVDLLDGSLYTDGDPHAVWTDMRRRAPVHQQVVPDGRAFWSVTRYRDVNDVLRDHTRFTSRRGTLLSVLGAEDPAADKMMAASDPPVHSMMREPMNKVLSHRSLVSRGPGIRRVVHRLLAPLLDGGVWDAGRAGAGFPMAFTGTLMGLPEADWPQLTRLTTTAIAPDDVDYRHSEGHGTLTAAHHELFSYFSAVVRRRIRFGGPGPEEDLIDFLIRMESGNRRLHHDEIVYNCYSLLLGANVTTPHALAGTVQALIDHPGEYRRLTADPSLVGSCVEEGLRWTSPANHFMRHAVKDTEVAGTLVREGDAVVAWLGSANRDERVFPDPFRFDITRTPNRHVAFGFGPHYCIGAPLARIALQLAFTEIAELVEEFRSAGPVEHLASNFVAGVKSMPVTARLRPGAAPVLSRALASAGPIPLSTDRR